jgi:hypothetical protein
MDHMKKASTKLPPISENNFQKQVIQMAHIRGWKVAHFRPARVIVKGKETWRTPVSADGEGFPDLVLARRGTVLFRELKSDAGVISKEQQAWLIECGGRVWRPDMWPTIERELY